MSLSVYHALIARKRISVEPRGMAAAPALKPHQAHTVDFMLRTGCAANFADTGLGKSFTALEWGRCVVEALASGRDDAAQTALEIASDTLANGDAP